MIATDANGEGVLEAAHLVQAGVATRVALFADLQMPSIKNSLAGRGTNDDSGA